MESREKCEQIISIFNNRALPGSQQPLVVKFADGGETETLTVSDWGIENKSFYFGTLQLSYH